MSKAYASELTFQGDGLNSRGFVNFGAFDNVKVNADYVVFDFIGLNTFGFIWTDYGIWSKSYCEDVTSTSWTSAETSITTTWASAE